MRLTMRDDAVAIPALGIAAGVLHIERTDPIRHGRRAPKWLFAHDRRAIRRPLRDFATASWARKCAIVEFVHAVAEWDSLDAICILMDVKSLKRLAGVVEGSRNKQLRMLVNTIVKGDGDDEIVKEMIVQDEIEEVIAPLREERRLEHSVEERIGD
jgi:hypothetical protein